MAPSSRQEWNERRGAPDMTENEGTASPRAENTRVPGVVLRSSPVRCTRRMALLFSALPGTPRHAGRRGVNFLVAIVTRFTAVFLSDARELLLLSSSSSRRRISNGGEISRTRIT